MTPVTRTVADIVDNLRRVFHVVNEQSKKVSRETGLTGPQLWAIKVMAESAPIKATELARRMYLHPATVVGIVDRLEGRGLVLRRRSKEDRRVVEIELTSLGRDLVAHAPEVAQGLLVKGLKPLPKDKLMVIAEGLEELVHILDTQEIPIQLILYSDFNLPHDCGKKKERVHS